MTIESDRLYEYYKHTSSYGIGGISGISGIRKPQIDTRTCSYNGESVQLHKGKVTSSGNPKLTYEKHHS